MRNNPKSAKLSGPTSQANKGKHPTPGLSLGRRERRAAETRIRLFRCALELIAERGLANVTVEDITEAADVGKGTFFNYFAGKDHVLGVMAEIQLGKVKEAASAAQSQQPIHAVLQHLLHRLAEEPGRSPRLARALISSFLASESVREILKRNMQEGRKTIAEVVALGQKRGEIDPQSQKGESCHSIAPGRDGNRSSLVTPRKTSARRVDGRQFSTRLEGDRGSRKEAATMKRRVRIAVLMSLACCGAILLVALIQPPNSPRPIASPCRMRFRKRSRQISMCSSPATRVDESEGARERSLSAALLPRVSAQAYANYQNRNLRAFGISVPGLPLPNVVGPFSNYDFRIYAQQNVVDLASFRALKASEHCA